MSTKTFKEIRDFNIAVNNFMRREPTNSQTKIGYALKRVSEKSVTKAVKEYQNAYQEAYYTNVETVQVDNALVDEKTKAILSAPEGSPRPYMYDKDGLKVVMDAERKFNNETGPALLEEFDKKEFDIEPYYTTDIPEDLTEEEKEAFKGFVIPE